MMQWLSSGTIARRPNLAKTIGFILVFTACLSFASAQQKPPNVLFLLADEHSGRIMGAAGDKIVKTPVLDDLAKKGFLFRNAYCQHPLCVPSRASMVSGRMASKLGVFGNKAHQRDQMRDTQNTIPRVFRDAGYTAEWIGKEHWGTTNAGIGFGDFNERVLETRDRIAAPYMFFRNKKIGRLPEKARTLAENSTYVREDTVYTDFALQWLDEYDGKKPFFLGLSLFMPHFPFVVPWEYFAMYKDVINLPRVTSQMLKDLPPQMKMHRELYNFGNLTDAKIKRARAVYYGMISWVDEKFGTVIKKLEEKGLRQNTIIVYVSDHGDHAGEHGLWFKNSFFEDSAKVPMIISYPKALPSNKKYWWPVQLIDIGPTLYDMCGIQIPQGLDGKSLLPVIRGQENGKKRHAISETYYKGYGRMVRIRNWKYIWYDDGTEQLFNVWHDPAEEFNRVNNTRYSTLVRNLRDRALNGHIPPPWK